MNNQAPGRRVYLCIVAAAILCATGYGYILLSSSLLDVQRNQQVRVRAESSPRRKIVPIDESLLSSLPEHAWIREAKFWFQDNDRLLFFNNFDEGNMQDSGLTGGDSIGQSMTVSPVLLVYQSSKPGEAPVVVSAERARINLSERVALMSQSSQSVRVISGTLTEQVVVTGPKGLRVAGHEFFVDEKSMKLWSRQPVKFQWEHHDGTAAKGADIQLAQASPDDRGLTSANGINLITLNGPVLCHLHFPAERSDEEDVHLDVRAASHFDYRQRENRGAFFGLPNRGYSPETQVVVTRTTEGEPDRLLCPELALEFHPRINPQTGIASNSRLVLGRISATGKRNRQRQLDRPVLYQSPEQQITARMEHLNYLVAARQIDLYGVTPRRGTAVPGAGAALVNITQSIRRPDDESDERKLLVPHLRILHGDHSAVEQVTARGRGRIQSQASGTSVRWNRRLVMQRAPDGLAHAISIRGGGSVRMSEVGLNLDAGKIDLTLLTSESTSTQSDGRRQGSMSLNISDAHPRTLIAEENVILRSAQVEGELTESLTINFRSLNSAAPATPESTNRAPATIKDSDAPRADDGRLSKFFGDRLTASVDIASGSDADPEWSHIELTGTRARVVHSGPHRDEEYVATGNKFVARNQGNHLADIQVLGSIDNAAHIESSMGHAEGLKIEVHQQTGVAEINGSGHLILVVDQDMNGDPMPPTPVKIVWTDFMRMEGKLARFVGGVRMELEQMSFGSDDTQLHDTTVRAPELLTHFVEPIQLAGTNHSSPRPAAGNDRPTIDHLHCVGKTNIHQESFEDEQLVGLVNATVVDLRLWPDSGKVTALGDGSIEATFRDQKTRLTAGNSVAVQANAPTEIGHSSFVRIKTTFVGRLDGNFSDRNVSLHDYVTVIRVPVATLTEVNDLENTPLAQMPEDSGMLKAEHVDIAEITGTEGAAYEMTARHNARLYSRDFSGDADEITYDSSKELYELSAAEGRNINAQQHSFGARQPRDFNGPRVQYNTRTRQAKGAIDGARLQ